MTVELVPVREAFPTGVWDQACQREARRRVARWRADLADGTDLRAADHPPAPAQVRVHARGPAELWVTLQDPDTWWPAAAGWHTTDWRDTLLLHALQPVLVGLSHWLPGAEPWQCEWMATPTAPHATAWSLALVWTVGGQARPLTLSWPTASTAAQQWFACGQHGSADADGDPYATEDGWPDAGDLNPAHSTPTT